MPKLATNLPKPSRLTECDLKRINKESTDLVNAIEKRTKNMELLTAEDLMIVIK